MPLAGQYELSNSWLGGRSLKYVCPHCGGRLRSPLADAGKEDCCPSCHIGFTVPAAKDWSRLRKANDAADKWAATHNSTFVDALVIRAPHALLALGIVAGIALVCILIVGAIRLAFFDPADLIMPSEETRVSQYESLLKHWYRPGLVSHFPATVPSQAENVRLSAFPGFMMSGARLQVRLQLPAPEVRKIYDEAMKSARQYHDGGGSCTLTNMKDKGLISTDFHTSGTSDLRFPDDYRVFVLDAVDGGSPGYPWNHGSSKGIVVSLSRNEVIYFAEDW